MALIVYNETEEACQIEITFEGEAVDFTPVTRMVLTFRESDLIADTDSDDTLITWNSDGEVVFTLGLLGLDVGTYTGLLRAYDAAHPTGQTISHPNTDGQIVFDVVGAIENVLLIVQSDDGDVEDANGYITVDYFKSYHTTRGRLVNYDNEQIQIAIINGTDYMDTRFNYNGYKLVEGQTTEFPRDALYDKAGNAITGIPREAKQACAEYSYIALGKELNPTPDTDSSGALIQSKSEKVGPISESVTYVNGATQSKPKYPIADQKLFKGNLIASGGGVIH